MPSFVDKMLEKHSPTESTPEQVVAEFLEYYKGLYDHAIAAGRERQLSYLSSVQTNLSQFKRRVQGASPEWKKRLHISKAQALELSSQKVQNLRKHSIDMLSVDGVQTVLDCRALLQSPSIPVRIIALACLTGRRMTEIARTAQFADPKEQHGQPDYWAHVSGLLKQRQNIKTCEVPLFERRERVVACLRGIRAEIGDLAPQDINRIWGKKISRAMQRYCPHIGNIHAFRKFYVIMAHHYFNDRNCSISRLGADVLCHREMNTAVLPYLNMHVTNMEGLDFP